MKVEGLTKSFGKQLIWGDVSLVLPRGEICVMLGPSGSGTSVFLKVLISLLKPDKGHVDTDGYAERFPRDVPRERARASGPAAGGRRDDRQRGGADGLRDRLRAGRGADPAVIDKLTTTAGGEQELVHHRVVVSVQREGDTWLVDDIASY